MSRKYFLKKSHDPLVLITLFIIFYLIIDVIFVLFLIKIGMKIFTLTTGLIIFTALTGMILYVFIKHGLYIDGESIYFKFIIKHFISIQDIAGIKILPSYTVSKYRMYHPIKNKKGELLYSAILVKSISAEMYEFKRGDVWFFQKFRKNIICMVTYERNAIEYLRTMNTNIVIMM